MLLNRETLEGIRRGIITLAFRKWRRPTVKTGGTLLTPIGQLAIESVEAVRVEEITESEAIAAGFPDLAALLSRLSQRDEGEVYRVRLSLAGPDPRIALGEEIPDSAQMEMILQRLERLDTRSTSGPWTRDVLELLRERPAERAADLAADLGMDKTVFKANVRKLKALGLTESLAVGYRLSRRGAAVLRRLGQGA